MKVNTAETRADLRASALRVTLNRGAGLVVPRVKLLLPGQKFPVPEMGHT